MKWRLWLVLVVFAASCAAPQATEAWQTRPVTPTEDTVTEPGVCDDVRALVLGRYADETTLDATLAELARLAATTGATAALPLLNDIRDLGNGSVEQSGSADVPVSAARTEAEQRIALHDLLVEASRLIDDATSTACDVPAFSALYATTGFPDCHFEMEIPIAAYTAPGTPGTCTGEGHPTFLPCFSADGDHLAVDCASGGIVQASGDRWVAAGPPRVITIDREVPDLPEGPEIISPRSTPACAGISALFATDPGEVSDFDRLPEAAATLSADIRDQIEEFIAATVDPPSFDEFEALVSALDASTAEACGLPLVSAWVALTTAVDTLPCWTPTGAPYPAYEIIDCA